MPAPAESVDTIVDTVASTAADVTEALADRRAYASTENPSGEQQLAADVYADDRFAEELLALPEVGGYASEERESIRESSDGGSLHVACDPLDGSSNLKSNGGMGTIVGIYDDPLPAGGQSIVGAGYILYGPITTMVFATDGTVTEYLLRDGTREVLSRAVSLPEEPVVYGFGGRRPLWTDPFRAYVQELEADRLKLRYGGAMVGDVNQVLTYGGIFGYPMLTKAPEGKLRLQFEGIPIAHIIETVGGRSSDGERSLSAKVPTELHERTPVFVGNAPLIQRLEDALD